MIRSGRLAAATAAAWLSPFGSPVVAQTGGTVDIGASVIEYDGFLVSGAAVLSPAIKFDAPDFSLGAQGAWTIFESGNQVVQGTAAGAWLTPGGDAWRVEVSGSVGGAKYADERAYGHVLGRARLHFFGDRAGGWVSGTTGGSFGVSADVPVELAIGGWSVHDRIALVGTLSGTWLPDDRYVDLLGAVRWTTPRVELEARGGVRPWTESGGGVGDARTGAYGDLSAFVSLTPWVGFAVSGGGYPSDPVRRVLGATYLTAGLRFEIFRSRAAPGLTIGGAMARAVRDRAVSRGTSRARLELAPSGSPRALWLHVPDARSVELMADFTDWRIVELVAIGSDVWELRLPLEAGVHRLNIRIDSGPWGVPEGARLEQTEFGNPVGVVVVR